MIIPASPNPKRFGLCADEWQRQMLAPQIPAIEHLAGLNDDYFLGNDAEGNPQYRGPMRFMNILARGHNKSSAEAWIACWLAAWSRRIIHGYILAADRDQGRLVIQAAEDVIRLNPWIPVTIQRNALVGPAGTVEVLPCDAASSMGLRGNFYIADEYVHWKRQDEWTAMTTGLRKVTPTVFCVMSNAGLLESWQHEVFLNALADPTEWAVFHEEGTLASYLSPAGIARDRKLIPPSEAERLYDNKWIDPAAEHDYLRRAEIAACGALGKGLKLIYRLRRQHGVSNYVGAIDYGPRRDRTALCIMHMNEHGIIVLDRLEVWQGTPDSPVQVEKVEAWIKETNDRFAPNVYVLDPFQMEGTIQKMTKEGLPVEAWSARAGQGNFEMAQLLREIVVDRKLAWYEGAGDLEVKDKRTGATRIETLADEMAGLRVKKMPYGYRFDHENQKHDDRSVCIAMGAKRAIEFPHVYLGRVQTPQKPLVEREDEDL